MKYFVLIAAACACLAAFTSVDGKSTVLQGGKLLPAYPPEVPFNKTVINLNNSLVTGYLECLVDGVIKHLDEMTDTLAFNLLALSLKGGITLPRIGIVVDEYIADFVITFSNGTVSLGTGDGLLDALGTDVHLDIDIVFSVNLITSRISIKTLDGTPSIGGCTVNAPGAMIDNRPVNFELLCSQLSQLVDQYWVVHKDTIIPDIIIVANIALQELTLQDLIDLIGGGSGSGRIVFE